jgi:hypothetical protein
MEKRIDYRSLQKAKRYRRPNLRKSSNFSQRLATGFALASASAG